MAVSQYPIVAAKIYIASLHLLAARVDVPIKMAADKMISSKPPLAIRLVRVLGAKKSLSNYELLRLN